MTENRQRSANTKQRYTIQTARGARARYIPRRMLMKPSARASRPEFLCRISQYTRARDLGWPTCIGGHMLECAVVIGGFCSELYLPACEDGSRR